MKRIPVRLSQQRQDVVITQDHLPVLNVLGCLLQCLGHVQSLTIGLKVALDEGSRTSAALTRILLKQRYGLEPKLLPFSIGQSMSDIDADAVLMIGDRAMHSPTGPFAAVWDLGDQWCRWSELPFVFAIWVARSGVDLQGVDLALRQARDLGVQHLDEIADQEAAKLGLSHPECVSYLRDNLYFHLGPREQQGLALYYQLASEMKLAPEGLHLEFNHYSNLG